MEPGIEVQPGEVAVLAAELAGLARELDDDALRCRSAGARLADSLGDGVGEAAAAAAGRWADLLRAVADRTGVLAGALVAAAAATLDHDRAVAEQVGRTVPGRPR